MIKDKFRANGDTNLKTATSLVHSSVVVYLAFASASGSAKARIELRYKCKNSWLTQKAMATHYEVSVSAINQHLKRIFNQHDLGEPSVVKHYLTTTDDRKGY
jgi:hypothetical protein